MCRSNLVGACCVRPMCALPFLCNAIPSNQVRSWRKQRNGNRRRDLASGWGLRHLHCCASDVHPQVHPGAASGVIFKEKRFSDNSTARNTLRLWSALLDRTSSETRGCFHVINVGTRCVVVCGKHTALKAFYKEA